MVIGVDKTTHEYLAVESVHETAVSRDDVTEIFDVESSLEATGEEATKGPNDGRKQRQSHGVQHKRIPGDGS